MYRSLLIVSGLNKSPMKNWCNLFEILFANNFKLDDYQGEIFLPPNGIIVTLLRYCSVRRSFKLSKQQCFQRLSQHWTSFEIFKDYSNFQNFNLQTCYSSLQSCDIFKEYSEYSRSNVFTYKYNIFPTKPITSVWRPWKPKIIRTETAISRSFNWCTLHKQDMHDLRNFSISLVGGKGHWQCIHLW